MKGKVTVIDRGMRRLMDEFAKAGKGAVVKVGIQGEKAAQEHKDKKQVQTRPREGTEATSEWKPMTNVKIGLIHEFGTKDGRIPERSHWRAAFDANQANYKELLRKVVSNFTSVATARGDIRMVGERYKQDVLNMLVAGITAKDKTAYLHKSGQYRDSFSVVMDD